MSNKLFKAWHIIYKRKIVDQLIIIIYKHNVNNGEAAVFLKQ